MSAPPQTRPPEPGASLVVAWRLEGRTVLVVGGGEVAAARVLPALDAGARVRVVSPTLGPALRLRRDRGELTWTQARWAEAHLDGVHMVFGALDDPARSAELAAACRARAIPVNCADLPDLCDFWFAAQVRRGDLQLAISTNGAGPGLGVRLKARLAAALPDGTAQALSGFRRLRRAIRAAAPAPAEGPRRIAFLRAVARDWPWAELARLDGERVTQLVARFRAGGPPEPDPGPQGAGGLVLVGAGPGDRALLTGAATAALQAADLILADRLVPPALLEGWDADVRIARKWPGRADAAQAELEAAALAGVRAGLRVVRLKCGDPFVFGRGGEEVERLGALGVPVRVVPGISSALAAPLLAGIPATWRGEADRVLVLTGRGRGGATPRRPAFDADTTYIWLMSVGVLADLVGDLRAGGFPGNLPCAIIERGGHADMRCTEAPLAELSARARAVGVRAPAVVVMGRVVARARQAEGAAPRAAAG